MTWKFLNVNGKAGAKRRALLGLVTAAAMAVGAMSPALADDLSPMNPFAKFADPVQSVLAVQTTFEGRGDVVRVVVYDSEDSFLQQPRARLDGRLDDTGLALLPISTLTHGQVASGDYALVVYLDENNDGRLNRNFVGKPKEPFIFSNNIKPKLSKPSFEQTRVALAPGKVVVVTLQN